MEGSLLLLLYLIFIVSDVSITIRHIICNCKLQYGKTEAQNNRELLGGAVCFEVAARTTKQAFDRC
jgi:hypothetical protein